MRMFTVLPMAAALGLLIGSAALADERTTSAATLVNPTTHAYAGTFTQSCPATGALTPTYVGVYLGQAFNVVGNQWLGIYAANKMIFQTSRNANGEEHLLYEVGGYSSTGCVPVGSTVKFIFSPGGMNSPMQILGVGTIKSI